MSEKYRVLIVEDEPIILRHTVRKVKELSDIVEVVGGVESAAEALEQLEALQPEILLTDIEMAGIDGLELIRQAKERWPMLRTIILSGYDNFEYAQAAVRYGADDYLLKPIDETQLKEVFQRVCEKIKLRRRHYINLPSATPEDDPSLAEEIQQYLITHYNENITVSDLAAWFNYAPSYISRVFKKEFGTSPIQFQTDLRIKMAKTVLETDEDINIKTVASTVGYEDARYFSRVFRQATGVPPSEWGKEKDEE